ncbi:MAG: hypothetical protein K2X78_05695 [Burkholderiaceae bacterium]|nr:hypothetical protein [Burkholderiaceae bacterium]
MLFLRLFAPLLALACVLPASAGMEKESHSTRGGLFFAMLTPDVERVMVRFDDKAQLQQLAQHCNTGKAVFALQAGGKYQCKAEVSKTTSGADDWEGAGVTVQGPVRQTDRREYALFSSTPPATPRWEVRKLDPDGRSALHTFLQSDTRRFGGLLRQLKLDDATAIRQPQGVAGAAGAPLAPRAQVGRETLVVPGKRVRDADAFYDAQRHHVFVRIQGAYAYMGEVPGAPASYVDIDGNDLPGLVVSEGCDGWCISLWGLTGGLRQVGTFGGH